ncbi:O-antigen ligase family protein [uncultured Cellulomonas sp.]|uniref:O-antigen ligase family protein n=1 Tax=uncultured Cellulomonas sp. TaxID=189682 RepID=UPI0028F06F9D|nr:O-antigen ligase family protein [uncultured Cellulomonas sp.]
MIARALSRRDALLAVGVWLAAALPQLAILLTQGRGFEPATAGPDADGALVQGLTTVCNLGLLALCAALVALGAREAPWRRWPLLGLLLLPWVVVVAAGFAAGSRPAAMTVLYPAVVTAAWAVRVSWRVVPVLGWLTAGTAAVSLVAGLVIPDLARYQDYAGADADKSGPLGILAGLLPSGNNLGLALAVGIPSVLALRGVSRLVAGTLVLAALAWSWSRGAWLAAVVVLVAAVVLALVPARRRGLVAALGMAAVALVAVVLPLVTSSASAMANRGGYWVAGREAWADAPLVGHGWDYYDRLATTADDLGGYAYHAHNQLMQLLVTGGVVLVVVVTALLVVGAVRAARAAGVGDVWPALTVTAVLAAGIVEVPFGVVDRTMFWPYVLVPLCVVLLGAPRPVDGERVDARAGVPDAAVAGQGGPRA